MYALLLAAIFAASDLEKAQQQLAAKKYAEALKSLEAAEKKGGLDHDSLLVLHESKGLAQASLKKLDKAEESFKVLLALDPRHDMTGKYKGEVVKAVEAAQAWLKDNGALSVVALDPGVQGGKVKQVSVSVKNDPLKLINSIRIYLKQDGGTWKPVDAPITNGVAAADTDGQSVEFWAEADDAHKNQLMFLGSALRPIKQTAPEEIAEVKPEPKPEPAPAAAPKKEPVASLTPAASEPAPAVTEEAPKQGSMLRPVSLVILGAAAVAAAVGIYFGATSAGAGNQIRLDQMAGTFSNVELYDRDQSRIGQARIANGLFIGAGVAALAAVLMFVLGG
jgi:hypothetical protein